MWKKIASLFLVVLTLSGSMGFSLHKMRCLQSGKLQVSLSEINCCAENIPQRETVESKCCAFDVYDLTINEFAPVKEFLVSQHVVYVIKDFGNQNLGQMSHDNRTNLGNFKPLPPILYPNIQIQFQSFLC